MYPISRKDVLDLICSSSYADMGMELSLEIDLKNVAGAEVFDVDQGSLYGLF